MNAARSSTFPVAPELAASQWFNTEGRPTLAALRGEVVVIEAFQMLCPGCVSHGLPQAQRIQQTFGQDLTVLGLHTVFEHHAAMTPISLKAFLHEYRITFPVGVDEAEVGVDLPVTMRRYGLRGTPSLVVVDRAGNLRVNAFGQTDDLAVGAALARLIDEDPAQTAPAATLAESSRDESGCHVTIRQDDASCGPAAGCSAERVVTPKTWNNADGLTRGGAVATTLAVLGIVVPPLGLAAALVGIVLSALAMRRSVARRERNQVARICLLVCAVLFVFVIVGNAIYAARN